MADDIRHVELGSLEAIYQDDIEVDHLLYSGKIYIPIKIENGINIHLLQDHITKRSSKVHFLPPIIFTFTLPQYYPYDVPPIFDVTSLTISKPEISNLKAQLLNQWRNSRDQILFSLIDTLQEKAESMFQLAGQLIECTDIEYEQIIENDNYLKQKEFDESTFTCEICQDVTKGDKCVQFDPCMHIFCIACVENFFIFLINDGEVEKIHCPDFNCGKKFLEVREKYLRLDNIESDKFDFEEFKTQLMTPPITLSLLQRILGDGVGATLFNKFLTLFTNHQNALIAKLFPERLVSCPRERCPAMIFRESMTSRLVICRTCDYAFCNICRKSYHSDSIDCSRKYTSKQYGGIPIEALEKWILAEKNSRDRDVLRYKYGSDLLVKVSHEYTMDKLFTDMLLDTSQGFSKCPMCDLIIQRLEGCNKMKCSSCATFFCNLCGCFLPYDHPYEHFNTPGSSCYGKLFHGMVGMEDIAD